MIVLILVLALATGAGSSQAVIAGTHSARKVEARASCKVKRRKAHKRKQRSCLKRSVKGTGRSSSPAVSTHGSAGTNHVVSAEAADTLTGVVSQLIEALAPVPTTPQEAPTVEAPKKEEPKKEEPKKEAPKKEEPKKEEPKKEEPKKEEPKKEEPKKEEPKKEEPKKEEKSPEPSRFFAPTSFWNEPLSSSAQLDPSSAAVISELAKLEGEEQSENRGPMINTKSWSVPVYTVPANQPTVTVTLLGSVSSALQSAWDSVPLPAEAHPAAGTDEHLVVWQPSTNRMWEFWHLEKDSGLWYAGWGGAMDDVSGNQGVYGPEAWPGATNSWGATASSLPLVGGLMTLEDLQRGKINHALAISVPNVRAGSYASPAHRTDGESKEAASLPEGAHLRLEPSLNLASLHLPRIVLLMAEAAQRYGILVRDRASNIAFYGEDPTPTGTEPYPGLHGYFEGKSPAALLATFPWSHLQLLKMELHSTS